METTLYIREGEGIVPLGICGSSSVNIDMPTSEQPLFEKNRYSFSCSFTISKSDWDKSPIFQRYSTFDPRTLDRHSSYYIPFYFPVCGSSRKKESKQKPLSQKKVERNVRPKGTHTHWKFYR